MWTVDVAGSHQGGQSRGRIDQQFHRFVEPGGQWRGVGLEDDRSGQGPGACGRIPHQPIGPRVGHCHFQGVATRPDGVGNIHPNGRVQATPARCRPSSATTPGAGRTSAIGELVQEPAARAFVRGRAAGSWGMGGSSRGGESDRGVDYSPYGADS